MLTLISPSFRDEPRSTARDKTRPVPRRSSHFPLPVFGKAPGFHPRYVRLPLGTIFVLHSHQVTAASPPRVVAVSLPHRGAGLGLESSVTSTKRIELSQAICNLSWTRPARCVTISPTTEYVSLIQSG